MYHARFRGNHYEIGLKWGTRLLKYGKILFDNVPFEISQERLAFAEKCRPFYKKWYPEVLEEIRGIAEGQKADSQKLEAVLFSMYCIMPENKCSCFAFKSGEHIILARNSDFLPEMEKMNMNCIYMLKHIPIASSQTFTAVDTTGKAAVIECNSEKLEVCYADDKVPFVSAVNEFYLERMKTYQVYGVDNWNAKERYDTIRLAFCRDGKKAAVPLAADILRGKYGFICQYDRKTGKDTVWSVIYDVGTKKIYRCEGNPSRKRYKEDNRFAINAEEMKCII